jgi:hypothetical protein
MAAHREPVYGKKLMSKALAIERSRALPWNPTGLFGISAMPVGAQLWPKLPNVKQSMHFFSSLIGGKDLPNPCAVGFTYIAKS